MTIARVESIGHKGDGLVSIGQGVLHVPKVLPGETIEIADGALARVVEPSPDRVAPFCAHHARCGGCKFQHWRNEPYRIWKRELLLRALAAQALETTIAEMVDAHGQGRRRVTFHVREVQGLWQAGFMEQKSHDLCAIDACPVLVPALVNAPPVAASFGSVLGNCDVAITAASNGIDVAVKAERNAVARRVPALIKLFESEGLLRLTVNGDEIAMRAVPFVAIGKANVSLPATSFLQATEAGEAALASLVAQSFRRTKHVADLFSGLGTFSLPLAEKMRVTAYDSDRPAIASLDKAIRNTQGLKPASAILRNLFNAPLTWQELQNFDAVVLDPPRAGAEEQAKHLARSGISQITYVSCDPQSFARDAAVLVRGGYKLRSVTPVDQFKWTPHLELVASFEKT